MWLFSFGVWVLAVIVCGIWFWIDTRTTRDWKNDTDWRNNNDAR